MKLPQPPLPVAILTVVAALASQAPADETLKIDLAAAKAQLAKAKAEAAAGNEEEPDATPPGDTAAERAEEQPKSDRRAKQRRRLFGGRDRSEQDEGNTQPRDDDAGTKPAPANARAPQAAPQAEPPAPAEPRFRVRLFRRDRDEPRGAEDTPDPAAASSEGESTEVDAGTDDETTERSERRRLFARILPGNDDDHGDGAAGGRANKPEAQPEAPADAARDDREPAPERERTRLLANLFRSDGAEDGGDAGSHDEGESSVAEVTPAADAAPAPPDQSRGGVFGFLRRSGDEKLAETQKTKLGKSLDPIEQQEAAASGPRATEKQKIEGSGELGWYVVTEAETPFYAIGPGQPLPPEKLLDRGSMLTVTKGGWGWCNVRLDSGELGVVSSKAMRPATVAEVKRHNRPVASASRSRGSRLFDRLSRGPAPAPELPKNNDDLPIRNFGLLPPIDATD